MEEFAYHKECEICIVKGRNMLHMAIWVIGLAILNISWNN